MTKEEIENKAKAIHLKINEGIEQSQSIKKDLGTFREKVSEFVEEVNKLKKEKQRAK